MEEDNIIIRSVNPVTFEYQTYSEEDNSLISSSILDTAFTASTDYIEYYAYDENRTQVYPASNIKAVALDSYTVEYGDTLISPDQDLANIGLNYGSYYSTYNFYRRLLGSDITINYYIDEISADRTELRLKSTAIDVDTMVSESNAFILEREASDYFVDFLLNFGNDTQCIANNIRVDEDDVEPSLLIKLYEPLPEQFSVKSSCWIVQEISTSQAYNVEFPIPVFEDDDFVFLQGPNYSIQAVNATGESGQSYNYNTLIGSNLTSSYNQLENILNRKEIDISVDYTDYNNFIHFSSAKTRLENFFYKVGLIQSSSAAISASYGSITGATSGSFVVSSSVAALTNNIRKIEQNFDGYEYFLYYNSGSSVSYPKSTSTPPYALQLTSSAAVQTWITASALSASNFDDQNENFLYNTIPEYLRSDPDNAKYELFVDMVAQQYDNSWLYIKDLTNRFNNDNRLDFGISKDLVADAIKDFGIKLYSNNFNTNDLYTAFLGITPSGSTFPFPYMTGKTPGGLVNTPSGYEYVDTEISASDDIVPLDDVNKRLYKRIYHNLPYLLKRKGTIGGIRALITSYGIPDTILRISEFGGKDKDNTKDWDYNQNEFNYALHLSRAENGSNLTFISSSFVANSAFPSVQTSPQSVQFRFKTGGVPSGSAQITSSLYQNLFSADAGAASAIAVTLEYNSLGTSPSQSYSGSIAENLKEYGTLTFFPEGSNDVNKTASVTAPFFDGNWWSVQATVDYDGNQTASLYVANRIGDKIGFSGSGFIAPVDSTYYATATTAYFPTSSLNLNSKAWLPFSGALQEVRYWDTPLSESLFYDYVVNPYSTQANTINSTPDNLIFRASLGSDLDTGSRTSIHPKITGSWVVTQSFATNSTFYLNQEYASGSQQTWVQNTEQTYLNQVPGGIKNRITDKVRIATTRIPSGSTLSPFRSVQQNYLASGSTPNINYLEVAFSPQNQINDDIIAQIGAFNLGDYIGDPRQISESINSYPALDALRDAYFTKYIDSYNVNDFVRLIKFFDNSLFKMIEDFTPARTSLSSGVVIKQNLLERNKYAEPNVTDTTEMFPAVASIGQSAIDQKNIALSGAVLAAPKDYRTGSSDEPQYADSGSAIYTYKGGTGGTFDSFNTNFNAPISNSGEPYSGLTAAQVSASAFARQYPGVIQAFTESVEIELGTGFPVGSSRNNELVSGSGQGTQTVQRIDQREFYNGEFPNAINFRNPEICKTFFGQDAIIDYFFLIQWFNQTSFDEQAFLSPNNLPNYGNVWFWADTILENADLKPNSFANVLATSVVGSGPFVGGVNILPGEYSVSPSTGSGATFNLATAPNSTGNARVDVKVFGNATGSGYQVGDTITIPQATMQAAGFTATSADFVFTLVASNFLATEGVSNKVKYIKMSNFDVNGETILPFIEDSGYVIFNLEGAKDVHGNFLSGFQTFYIANYGIQNDNNPNTTDATLLIINEPPSSAAVQSADEQFYDLTFSASGQFSYYATSSGVDPNVQPDINFTQSVPQGYFPPVNGFPTQSLFKGWATSSYFQADIAGTIFRVSSGSGFYFDPFGYNNFNTGKKEEDFDNLVNQYRAPVIPWFINATASTYTALSASSLVTGSISGSNTASLALYTGDITASSFEIGPSFEIIPAPTPVITSSGQVVIGTPQAPIQPNVTVAPGFLNFNPNGDPAITIFVTATDSNVKWRATKNAAFIQMNGGGVVVDGTGSGTFTIDVTDSYFSSLNTNIQLRTGGVHCFPEGNAAGNGPGQSIIVNQDYYAGTGGSSGGIPPIGTP